MWTEGSRRRGGKEVTAVNQQWALVAWTLGSAEEKMYSGTSLEVQLRAFADGLDTGCERKTAIKDSKSEAEAGWRSTYGRRSWESGFALTKCEVLLRPPVATVVVDLYGRSVGR